MDSSHHGRGQDVPFTVQSVGGGPAEFSGADLDSASGVALVVLLRNHYCPLSRDLVKGIEANLDRFEAERVTVAAVLPDSVDRAETWERRYDPSFPLLSDPGEDVDAEKPTEFDAFGAVSEWMPQTPGVVVFDTGEGTPTVEGIYSGARPEDCPDVDEMLDIAAEARAAPAVAATSA